MAYEKHDAVPPLAVVDGLGAGGTAHSTIRRGADRGDAGRAQEGAPRSMGRHPGRPDSERPRLVCVVPPDRADVLLPPLREHFAHEPLVAVVVERRKPSGTPAWLDRAGELHRRAPIAERDPVRALPPELRHEARHLRLVQRMELLRRTHEDTDLADLIAKCLAVEPEAVSELWWRVSERVLARVGLRLGEHAAEGAARGILGRILDELPGYQAQRESLSAWLDAVVDRYAEDQLRRSSDKSG